MRMDVLLVALGVVVLLLAAFMGWAYVMHVGAVMICAGVIIFAIVYAIGLAGKG